MTTETYALTLSCPNRPGIVAAVATFLFQHDCNIFEAEQFDDMESDRFFMRVLFNPVGDLRGRDALTAEFAEVADRFAMTWTLRDRRQRRRVMILVSKFDHCLADLLYRWRIGELEMDIAAIVANHPRETYAHLDFDGIPFHYLPVVKDTAGKDNKAAQEAEILRLVHDTGTDLVVLARYMQILSDQLSAALSGRCINIHHSFLPSFVGAKPYHQAYRRGVKLIGATCHYVTEELDQGPIIDQDVIRIDHGDSVEDLVRYGKDIEKAVLARGLRYHLEGRVLVNGNRTVVFR